MERRMDGAVARAERKNANKAVAIAFLEHVYDTRDLAAARKCLAASFVHHEPEVAPGPDGFIAFLADGVSWQPNMTVEPVRVMSDGDFVLVHNRRLSSNQIAAFIDIMKIEQGRIVDYWQVHQPVPDTIANPNGMF
jgi:predicted SnoaL-like aldol condensation-catalyzing enzyme